MTQLDAMTEATSEFLQTYTFGCMDDIKAARGKLLDMTNQKYDEQNVITNDKRNYWKHEKDICPYQVAAIIMHVFHVRNVDMSDEHREDSILLEIYIDDNVINLVGEEYEIYRGTYRKEEKFFMAVIDCVNRGASTRHKAEVMEQLASLSPVVKRTVHKDLIAVNNGIFNYATKELYPFSPDFVFVTKPPIDYNPLAQNPSYFLNDGTPWNFNDWLYDLLDDEHKDCFEFLKIQVPLALLRCNVRWEHSVFLKGNRGNGGKGTLLTAWKALLGKGNYCTIPLVDFGKDFKLEPLLHANAIITDENPVGGYLEAADIYKSVVTNDSISVNRKHKMPITFTFHGLMVQCLNEIPRAKDTSDSFFRRQIYIPMEKCFTGHTYPEIKTDFMKRKEVLEYIMKTALESHYEKFDIPESCKLVMDDVKEYNDPVRQFWNDLHDSFKWSFLPNDFLYSLFVAYYSRNNPSGKAMGRNTFLESLRDIASDEWIYKKNAVDVLANGKELINGPEPLIVEYNLTDWMSNYKGRNKALLAIPNLKTNRYRGFLRKNSSE